MHKLGTFTPSRGAGRTAALRAATAFGFVALACSGAASAATEMPKVSVGVEKCVPTVLAKYPGEVLQVVLKPEDGQPVWEIEVEAKDGKLYDIECSGSSGEIVETEQRFKSAKAAGFKEKVKVTEAAAAKIALAKYPGKIESVEYEVEADGAAVYEFDIQQANGEDIRVEVDATTGELHEGHPELVEIGRMPKSK
jgi:uncharacterized membrane protein YkoI